MLTIFKSFIDVKGYSLLIIRQTLINALQFQITFVKILLKKFIYQLEISCVQFVLCVFELFRKQTLLRLTNVIGKKNILQIK